MTEDFILSFISEARELLVQLECDLLSLEKNPEDEEIIGNVFRIMHNIKGAALMYGFDDVQQLAHLFENVFDRMRSGNLKASKALITDTLHGKDMLLSMLEKTNRQEETLEFLEKFNVTYGDYAACEEEGGFSSEEGSHATETGSYLVFYTPDEAVFERGLHPEKVLHELSLTGRSKIIIHEQNGSWQDQMAQRVCHTDWEIYITSVTKSQLEEVFMFYGDDECMILSLSQPGFELETRVNDFFQRHYPDLTRIRPHVMSEIAGLEVRNEETAAPVSVEAPMDQNQETASRNHPGLLKDSSIKVSSQKLDELLNLVSELVIISASLEACTSGNTDVQFSNHIENLEKLTKKFRSNALDLRLVPVGNLLKKFNRQVRDLSITLGKKVILLLDGQETEIDKSILKAIESPLMHILRNSIDHGIETPEARRKKGKSEEGTIKISAFYSGPNVIIQVHDDGQGIDIEKIRTRAAEKGYISADKMLTDKELIRMIMEPGFTTSEKVSLVSGRGVGMDVVKMELNAVGGSVEIETEQDLGTSITLRLPTTLSIIDTLLLQVDQAHILVPLLEVEFCYKERRSNLYAHNSNYISYKNNMVPYVSLRQKFNSQPSRHEDEMVVIISKYDKKYAILVDDILGEHQAVIKPLGAVFSNHSYFSGGSIMADGNLALVLDTDHLFNQNSLN